MQKAAKIDLDAPRNPGGSVLRSRPPARYSISSLLLVDVGSSVGSMKSLVNKSHESHRSQTQALICGGANSAEELHHGGKNGEEIHVDCVDDALEYLEVKLSIIRI